MFPAGHMDGRWTAHGLGGRRELWLGGPSAGPAPSRGYVAVQGAGPRRGTPAAALPGCRAEPLEFRGVGSGADRYGSAVFLFRAVRNQGKQVRAPADFVRSEEHTSEL